MAVPRQLFDELGAFQGISLDAERYLAEFLRPENNLFLPRPAAERDPGHKQLIPYALVVSGDRVLHYTRGGSGGEARLRAKGSIGIGGHVNPGDLGQAGASGHVTRETYLAAMRRELEEELEITGDIISNHMVALLNDDSNEVGEVHLGIIHIVRLARPEAAAREDSIVDPQFLTPAELQTRRDLLETWSQRCVEHLDHILAAEAAVV